jgi:hypothetical protein
MIAYTTSAGQFDLWNRLSGYGLSLINMKSWTSTTWNASSPANAASSTHICA